MTDVTASVQHLADQLGVTVDWARFHAHAGSAPVMRFIALAARVSFATSIQQKHAEQVGEALAAATGSANTADTDLAALLHAISIEQCSHRDEAIAEARALLGDLLRQGVVR